MFSPFRESSLARCRKNPGERHLVLCGARGRGDQECGEGEPRKGMGSKVSYPEQRLRRGV